MTEDIQKREQKEDNSLSEGIEQEVIENEYDMQKMDLMEIQSELPSLNRKIKRTEEILQTACFEDEEAEDSVRMELKRLKERRKYLLAKAAAFEIKLSDEGGSIAHNKHFDKYLFFRNIRERLKQTDVKVGQIEKEAGCQRGYMSRLDKPESTTDPTAEFMITASQMLGVSLDLMLSTELSELSPTETYIASLLEKLIRDTTRDKIGWEVECEEYLEGIEPAYDLEPGHPLFLFADEEHTISRFYSKAFGDDTVFHGNSYCCDLKNRSTLYLMNVACKDEDYSEDCNVATELWIYTPRKGISFLCGDWGNSFIADLVKSLNRAAAKSSRQPIIKKDFREALDEYLSDLE